MSSGNQMPRPPLGARDDADAAAAELELAWAVHAGQVEEVMRRTAARVRRRRVRAFAASLSIACLGVVAWVGWAGYFRAGKTAPAAAVASTVVSSVEMRILADGSVAELSRGAQMVVEFSEAQRRITLVRGSAHFEVSKDATRPFVVTAGDVEARALGTAFAVQLGASTVEVLVTHGTVQVDRSAALAAPSSRSDAKAAEAVLQAGDRVVVGLAADAGSPLVVETVSEPEASQRLAWRVPLLEFSGTPLSEVIPLFNRHGKPRLTFGDDSIRNLQLSGVLRADNTDLLLRLLAIEFGIHAEGHGEEIVLRR